MINMYVYIYNIIYIYIDLGGFGENHIIYDISFDKPQLNHPNHPRRHDTAPELAAGQVDHPS